MKKLYLIIVLFILLLIPRISMATTNPCLITSISLISSHDLGHGGTEKIYKITYIKNHYEVTVSASRKLPAPGEDSFKPSKKEITLDKNQKDIFAFIEALKKMNVFELKDLSAKVLLHPTFYEFEIKDSCNKAHLFEYVIEAGHHSDKKYQDLIDLFTRFFESNSINQ